MSYDRLLWEKAAAFHGHVCPGLAVGFRAALIALTKLDVERAEDEELVAIVENDACGVDAVQVLTGCTLGKGNLIYKDFGKQVMTLANRSTEKAVRVAVHRNVIERDPEHRKLMQKVSAEQASEEEEKNFLKKHRQIAEQILDLPDAEFCSVKFVTPDIPQKARIFDSVTCSCCGEGTMEPRVRIKNNQPVCLECFGEDYTRGW